MFSSKSSIIIFVLLYLLTTGSFAQNKKNEGSWRDPGWHPTLEDKMNLPKYCLAQYDGNFAKQTNTRTPVQLCGVYMNHLCPGLVFLGRAQNYKYSSKDRRQYAKSAAQQFDYTYKYMKPNCVLKADVDNANASAQIILKILK